MQGPQKGQGGMRAFSKFGTSLSPRAFRDKLEVNANRNITREVAVCVFFFLFSFLLGEG